MAFLHTRHRDKRLNEISVFQHSKFSDIRGNLWTTYDKNIDITLKDMTGFNFVHDKFAINRKGVLRGIHGDFTSWKLVTVIHGKVLQAVVDCRPNSKTFLRYTTFELDHENPQSILLPPGFGNAFLSITDDCVYHYKLAYFGEYTDADQQFTYRWNDARIGIEWPTKRPILSKRDELCEK